MKRILISLGLGAMIIGGVAPPVAHAQHFAPSNRSDQGSKIAAQLFRELRSRYGGEHLDIQQAGNEYRVRWRTRDGRVLNVRADARTGRIISTS